MRILIVDDHRSILLTYTLILQQQGHEVVGAPSCEVAEKHLDRGKFDLMLCDLGLGDGQCGFDVIDFGRRRNPGMRTVLLTGYGDSDVDREAERRGVPVLYKPVPVTELLDTLHTLTQASGAA